VFPYDFFLSIGAGLIMLEPKKALVAAVQRGYRWEEIKRLGEAQQGTLVVSFYLIRCPPWGLMFFWGGRVNFESPDTGGIPGHFGRLGARRVWVRVFATGIALNSTFSWKTPLWIHTFLFLYTSESPDSLSLPDDLWDRSRELDWPTG
jgi:hypothetical protein